MCEQTLNICQMMHLKELGVDTSCASMALVYRDEYDDIVDWNAVDESIHDTDVGEHNPYIRKLYGAFTLQDLIGMLPKHLKEKDGNYDMEILTKSDDFFLCYRKCGSILISFEGKDLKDIAYKMLCWLIDNDFIETA